LIPVSVPSGLHTVQHGKNNTGRKLVNMSTCEHVRHRPFDVCTDPRVMEWCITAVRGSACISAFIMFVYGIHDTSCNPDALSRLECVNAALVFSVK
jgi:hypothetical protein